MEAAKTGRDTDNTVADTMAPVAAKKTKTVVREPVSIQKKNPFQIKLSYLHYDLNFRQEYKIARNDLTFTLDYITMWHIRKAKVQHKCSST